MDPKHAKRLHKHTNLTDILIQIEDFFDGLDLYVFANWFEGEIFKGPEIRRYWVDLTLIYPYQMMPDPQGAVRLTKHGVKVKFKKELEEVTLPIEGADDYKPNQRGKPKTDQTPIWLIEISIPRKFIEELDDDDLEIYDEDDVNTENVSDARDENIDDEDGFKSEDGNAEEDTEAEDTEEEDL